MPKLDLTERTKLALTASLALAMGAVVGVALDSDPDVRKQQLEQLGDALAKGSATVESDKLDTAAYHRAVAEVRASDPDAIDLLTRPVDPGESVETEVVIPIGRRFAEVELVGPSVGVFVVEGVTYEPRDGGTLVKVTARNTGQKRLRLTALAHMEAIP